MGFIPMGWLSPKGKFTECGFIEHTAYAIEMIEKEKGIINCNVADDALLCIGYLKFTRGGIYSHCIYGEMVCPTDVQLDFIMKSHKNLSSDQIDAVTDMIERSERYKHFKTEKRQWANVFEYEVKVIS